MVAVALVLTAAAGRIWPLQALGSTVPYITFYPAVMISALYGGLSSGLLATILSASTILLWHPGGQPFIRTYADWLSMGVFLLNCTMISLISAAMLRAQALAKKSMEQTEAANTQLKATMTELESSRAELTRFNDQLKQLDRAKTEFFSNVSHEFRTPLTLMLGPIEEVLERPAGEVPPDVIQQLSIASRNALRLLKLVNTLLDFSRIEAGRTRVSLKPTDISKLTSALASNFHSVCDQATIKLVVDCPPLPEPVEVDRDMWEKIVLNLISNAFKFTFEGAIEVRLQVVDDFAELTVRDTGTGIPEAELPHIFERFHRIEGARGRTYEGSGIGLALVYELVKLNNGTITVESEVGRGTSFTVRLPRSLKGYATEEAVEEAPNLSVHARVFIDEAFRWLPDTEGRRIDADRTGLAHARILVADDNTDMRTYIRGLLEAAGYMVMSATNGEEALTVCREEQPDLIISDVMMPVLDGFGLVERLRSDERTASLPLILLSARAGEEARVDGLKAGADDYLVKPFAARELVARVDGAIRLARTRQDAARREREAITAWNVKLSQEMEERKKAEMRLVLAASVFNNIMEGVVVTNQVGTIVSVNPAFSVITGYQPQEAIGKNPRILKSGRHGLDYYREMWRQIKENGVWQGEIWNQRKDGVQFLVRQTITAIRDDKGEIQHYAAVFNDITESKRKEESIRHQAYHDALTGLPNRALFSERLEMALAHAHRNSEVMAVMFVDLDHFKEINDTLGHDFGDELLKTASARLTECVRESDTVARMGGDEFTIILTALSGMPDAVVVAEKVLTQLAAPFEIKGKELRISGSLGAALYPKDGTDTTTLLINADAAMYRTKQRGRNGYTFFGVE